MNDLSIIADADSDGLRIDKWLSNKIPEITRNAVQKLIENECILVNNKRITKNYKIKAGDSITVNIPELKPLEITPENIPIEIVYEDSDLLVVNKPKGLVVHPAPGHENGTLVNALLYHCAGRLSSINGIIRPGIVHRIDKNTSGLLIVAKTDYAHFHLSEQIKNHTFTREYEAIVSGRFNEKSGTVNAPIGRHPSDRKKMCVTSKNSKPSVTHYQVFDEYQNFSFIKLILETGRTHQIRVHMSYINHPVFGDEVYGKPVKNVDGQCLHARKIGFIHPVTNEYLEFSSELPQYFKDIMKGIGFNYD